MNVWKRGVATTSRVAATRRCYSATAVWSSPLEEKQRALHYPVIPKADFGKFKEYSVIHTDRSLNLMSDPFQRIMRDLNQLLKVTYNADKAVIIPGCVKNCFVVVVS